MKGFGMESVWLRTPPTETDVRIVHVNHEDTYKRLLADGWVVIEQPAPEPPTPEPDMPASEVGAVSETAPTPRKSDAQSVVRRARHGG